MSLGWSYTVAPAGIAGPQLRPQTPAPAWSHCPPTDVSAWVPPVPCPKLVCSGETGLMSLNEVDDRNVKCVAPERPDLVVMSTTPPAARPPGNLRAPGRVTPAPDPRPPR